MDPVSKSVLRVRLLEYFREVEQTGEELIILDDDRPVLKVVPIGARRPMQGRADQIFADVRGKVVYRDAWLDAATREWPET